MDIQRLREEGMQNELREILGSMLINTGQSQKDMAALMGVSPALLCRFLKRDKKYVPGIKFLLKMAHYIVSNSIEELNG